MRFQGRTVVLTGVGREGQVGEAIARAFAAEGASLVLVDRLAGEVEARAAALRPALAPGARLDAIVCDLTDNAAVERAAGGAAVASGGRLDAVVCIAGGFAMSGPVAESDPGVLQRMLMVNLTTAWTTTRWFVPQLRAARGALVYFSSVAALPDAHGAGMSAYAASKSGVLALMRAVAEEEKAHGVRANAVAPTSIRTADNVAAMGDAAGYVERESVADVVLFLCSDAARNVSGQVFRLA